MCKIVIEFDNNFSLQEPHAFRQDLDYELINHLWNNSLISDLHSEGQIEMYF